MITIPTIIQECDRQIVQHKTMSDKQWESGDWHEEYNQVFINASDYVELDESYLLKATEVESLEHVKDKLNKVLN